MPLVTVLGTPDSLPGNIAFGGGPTPGRYPSYFQVPTLQVFVDGVMLNDPLSASILYGHDVGMSSATVEFDYDPGLSKYSVVTIWCGAGQHHEVRFTGLYITTENDLWPPRTRMICFGMLWRAIEYRQAAFIGLPSFVAAAVQSQGVRLGLQLVDLLNGADSTDNNIVLHALQRVPNLQVDPADIGGTGRLMGVANQLDLVWPPYKSAMQYIQPFDEQCLGFRTYDTRFGRVARTRIFGYPTGDGDTQFTEGIDIWRGTGRRGVENLINGVFVEGANIQGAMAGLTYDFRVQDNPFYGGGNPIVEQFPASLAERSTITDPDMSSGYLNTSEVADWRLSEGNRELVNVQFVTFRDEILVGGRSIAVNSPHMGVQQPVWMQRVEIRVQANPVLFQQTIYGVGGGLPDFGPSMAYDPPSLDA